MKQRNSSDSLLIRSNDVINAGMKLFQEVQDSSVVDMVDRQAELIELLDRFLTLSGTDSAVGADKKRSMNYQGLEMGLESGVKTGGLPAKDDLAGVSRYLLACWLDELFVVDTELSRQWNENKLEMLMFGTNDRAWRFWDHVNSEAVSKNIEVQQIALSCIMHGFQGQMVESHSELSAWVEKCKNSFFMKAQDSWTPPPGLPIIADTPVLKGRGELDSVIRIALVFGVILLPVISFLVVYSIRS